MTVDLAGKTALVTGAASGIGRAAAQALALAGANVVVADLNGEAAEQAANEIDPEHPGRAAHIAIDVTQTDAIDRAIELALSRFGGLHIAVNNAGVTGPAKLTADLTDEEWEFVLGVNLTAVWRCMRAEIKVMAAAGSGAIVNVASTAGLRGGKGTAAYSASKHGVLGLTKSAALDYARRGIRINAVCPGPIDTPMLDRLLTNPKLRERLEERSVMGRNGQPGEVAAAILWLCSDDASFVNGQAIAVDGGASA